MEQIEIGVAEIEIDENNQVTPADSINMEHFEMAVEDNDDQVTLADSIKAQTEMTIDDENGMLVPLIDMLTDREKSGLSIDEFEFLDQFPPTNVILPGVNCSPRQVIAFLISARETPRFNLRKLHYNYKINSINYTKTDVYTFTDAMAIEDDVIVICYLSCLEQEYLAMPGMQELFAMMEVKYDLVRDNAIHKIKHFAITWGQVLYSFPSISLVCTYTPSKIPYSADLCIYMDQLTSSIRKRLIWNYQVASILPKLESKSFPITCLIAIEIELNQLANKINASLSRETQVSQIYENTSLLCLSEAFLKL
ncbi:uncharacterized protein LOC114941194 isoform X2 [Nylanderia fulva]|nr:uncharacterized protein LOC114941194 isoform X2 [Nylanderia fulva]